MEREKLENQKKLEETQRILEETRTKKVSSVGQLNVLNQQIKEKANQIATYEKEIALLDAEIRNIEKSMQKLNLHLKELKQEYAIMIYNTAKANDSYNKLVFLFSAQTFNQLVQRLKYFKHYSQARHKHVEQIYKMSKSLKTKRQTVMGKRKERAEVMLVVKQENDNLSTLKKEQETTINSLAKRENELFAELEERKKNQKKLEKLITDLIKAEMEKAAAKAAAQAQDNKKSKKLPEADFTSANFSAAKSKLNWPVQHGFIAQPFGKRPHPVLKNIMVDNLGVDIQTNKGEKVRSVFEGVVTAVAEVPGMNTIVMIQHGEYYTFYAKLKNVTVKNGQKLKAKETIGEVVTNDEDVSTLQFQVWKGHEKQDPEQWLIAK